MRSHNNKMKTSGGKVNYRRIILITISVMLAGLCLFLYCPRIRYPRVDCVGNSLLIELAQGKDPGSAEAARKLIERGAVVNVNEYGETPLTMACIAGNGEFIEMILQHGADINVTEPLYNRTPLTIISVYTNDNSLRGLRALLKHGADPNRLDGLTNTALMNATYVGNVRGVELLLSHGADPNIKDHDGRTAISDSRAMESWYSTNNVLHPSLRSWRWNETVDAKQEQNKYQKISVMLEHYGQAKQNQIKN